MPTDEETDMTTTEPQRTRAASVFTARPISIVCELLGVPRDDRLLFWRWAGDLSSPKALDELHAYVDVMIADRCRKPGDDLLSQLIAMELDGAELTVDDIHGLVAAMVACADTN
jgi:cytochrome P450